MNRLALALVLSCSCAAAASTTRLMVSIGNNIGDPEDPALRFATDDARRMLQVFTELGAVSPDRAFLLADKTAPAVRERLAEVSGRIAELHAAGEDVVLFLYVSAHAKDGQLHLSGTHLPLTELRDYAGATQARLRVLIVDACDSGAIARQKGGKPAAGFEVKLEGLPLTGQVVMTSSGSAEASEEWDSLGGSLFTHHLLTGLRGDADSESDGKVTLAELYSYAYRRTVAGSASTHQHPAFDIDVTGAGELVLSEPATARSALIFPAEVEGRFLISSQPRSDVVVEIDKRPGSPLQIAVPSGRYLVRKKKGQSTGLLSVELPYGGRATVNESELVWRNFAEVALKGGDVELKPSAVLAGAAFLTSPLEGTGPRFRASLGYRRTFGEWWALGRLSGSRQQFRAVGLTTTELSGAVGALAGYRWVSLPVVPYLGLGVELVVVGQSYVRDQEADIQRVFGSGVPARNALGFNLGPVLGLEIALPSRFFLLALVQGLVRYLPVDQQPWWTAGLDVSLALGVRF